MERDLTAFHGMCPRNVVWSYVAVTDRPFLLPILPSDSLSSLSPAARFWFGHNASAHNYVYLFRALSARAFSFLGQSKCAASTPFQCTPSNSKIYCVLITNSTLTLGLKRNQLALNDTSSVYKLTRCKTARFAID